MPSSMFAIAAPVGLFLILWGLFYLPLAGVLRAAKEGVQGGAAELVKKTSAPAAGAGSGVSRAYSPILIVLLVGGAAAAVAAYLFVELAEQVVVSTSAVDHLDETIHTWFGHERQPATTLLLTTATNIGSSLGLGTLVALVMALLLTHGQRASAVFLIVTSSAGALLNLVLKAIFSRTRPDLTVALVSAHSFSFPSGHAMGSFVTFGALAYIALRQQWSWAARSASLALALTMVVLVGVSRVYLGVHWASDIAGGWSAGAVWLTAAIVAFEMLLRRRTPSAAIPLRDERAAS